MIRIFLIGDLLSILKGLHMQIALESDLMVVGETRNHITAPQLIEESKPDVVVMDLDMPTMDTLNPVQELIDKGITTPIVALSFDSDQAAREGSSVGGVIQFIKKQASVTELLAAIHQAAKPSK